MTDSYLNPIREDYDRIAEEYAKRLFHELDHKPLDRELLSRFATRVRRHGRVCDMGCGPGHIARRLRDGDVAVFGLDLSEGMLREARRLNPDISFQAGNILALDLPDSSLAGITAFYAIVNLRRESLPQIFREMARVLEPEGQLLLAFHIGDETLHPEQMWGHPVTMEFSWFPPAMIEEELKAAGFAIEELIEREPYAPGVEHQTRRAYLFARKPTAPAFV